MNPFLPLEYCIPDAEPHIFGDRVYIYGSMDTPGEKHYCGHQYRVFSARTDDLAHWTDHGAAFSSSGSGRAVPWSSARLFAPDVCEINGTYYLYFCMADKSEGVASSQNPAGPFTNTRRLSYPPGVKDGRPLEEIDPAVFKDDDGHVYYYWGQEKAEAARLKTPYELDAESYVDGIIDARRHFFFEGSSMRKRRGVYYYIYCAVIDGKANHLAYATSCSPLGPFQYRGVIIDNQKCDPESWNIHGSIIEIDGQWYVLYHRSSNRGFFSRRACAEKIYFDQGWFH